MVRIDLENTIEPHFVSEDLTEYSFNSDLRKGKGIAELHVHIKKHPDPLLPNVYNLAFGPLREDGKINDTIKLEHTDINKIFSTIILFSITFLRNYPDRSVGMDGSNEARAYLYHRIIKSNQKELSDYVVCVGVDWYVRLLRNNEVEKDDNGFAFFKPRPEPFDCDRSTLDLYRYYIISLNQ